MDPVGEQERNRAEPFGISPVTVHAKMLGLELLQVKAELERELETFALDCSDCGRMGRDRH